MVADLKHKLWCKTILLYSSEESNLNLISDYPYLLWKIVLSKWNDFSESLSHKSGLLEGILKVNGYKMLSELLAVRLIGFT